MEKHHRGEWGSNLGFLMAAVGSAVGLGNIWAFPYKMGNGGGFAFLVIYLILAVTVGFNIMLCELAIGRRAGRSVAASPITWWRGLRPRTRPRWRRLTT